MNAFLKPESLANASPEPKSMWQTLLDDPEVSHLLRAPLRLARGVEAFPYRDGVVLAGGPSIEMFSGFGARAVLAQVLPLLDGTRTVAGIEAETDLDPQQVCDIVANLFMSGLLRSGTDGGGSNLEVYLDRLIGHTGAFSSGAASAQWLRERSIAIHAPGETGERMKALYEEVVQRAVSLVCDLDELQADTDLLVVVSTPSSGDPAEIFARANLLGIPALNIEIGERGARFGPFVLPQRTASYACYRAVHTPTAAGSDASAVHPAAERFWSALAIHMAVSTLARTVKSPSFNGFTDYRWENGRQVERQTSIARLHRWDENGRPHRLPLDRGQPGYEGWKQYCGVALQSAAAAAPNAYLVHYKTENIRSIYERVPALYSGNEVALPNVLSAAPLHPMAAPQGGRLNLATLATMATFCAGFGDRDGLPHRLAPTGGNLGSTLLMFLVRDVDGLAPGAYWFDGQKRVLERVPKIDVEALSGRFGFDRALPAIMLSFGNIGKVGRKYGGFSFNISWYDSGVLLAYARNLADALGLGLSDLPRADADALLEALGLPESTLVATGAIGLTAGEVAGTDQGGVDAITGLIRRRRGVRAWPREELATSTVEAFLESACSSLERYGRISTHRLDLSLILALKLSDGEDGLYHYRAGSDLRLLAPFGRELHGSLLSQMRLTESPMILLPNIDLGKAIEEAGDEAVESAYKAAGAVVGELWLCSERSGLAGTACGGAFDGEIRVATGRHGLDHFAPLSLCLGPVEGDAAVAADAAGRSLSA